MVSDHQPRLRSTCHLYKVALGKLPHYLSKRKPQFKWVKRQPLMQSCAFLLKFTIQKKNQWGALSCNSVHYKNIVQGGSNFWACGRNPMVLPFKCNLFSSVPFVLYVVLNFESVDEILWCYYSNETSSAVLSHGTIYLLYSSNFWVCGWNPMVLPFKWNLFSSTFTWYYLFSM